LLREFAYCKMNRENSQIQVRVLRDGSGVTGGPPVKTVRSRRLAAILREKRRAAGLTPTEAARRADLSPATVYRAEEPACRPKPNNVKALLQVYGVTDPAEAARIITLAKEAARPGWWHQYDISQHYASFVALEAEAAAKLVWEPSLVPGLLQVPGYARAVIACGPDYLPPADVDKLVRVRAERQKILHREDPLRLTAVLDEAVLRRPAGTPAVMRDQLDYLRQAAGLPNVTVRVLPSGAGAHPAMTGPFAILRYPDPADHDVLYTESLAGPLYAEEPRDLERAHRAFCALSSLALSPRDSLGIIAAAATLAHAADSHSEPLLLLPRETMTIRPRNPRPGMIHGRALCTQAIALSCPETGGARAATADRTATAQKSPPRAAASSSATRRTGQARC